MEYLYLFYFVDIHIASDIICLINVSFFCPRYIWIPFTSATSTPENIPFGRVSTKSKYWLLAYCILFRKHAFGLRCKERKRFVWIKDKGFTLIHVLWKLITVVTACWVSLCFMRLTDGYGFMWFIYSEITRLIQWGPASRWITLDQSHNQCMALWNMSPRKLCWKAPKLVTKSRNCL